MAIPSGSYRVATNPTRPAPFPPAPPKSRRNEIYSIVNQQFGNIASERVLIADSIEIAVEDPLFPLQKFIFNNYRFVTGDLLPVNIKENYLYINAIYVKKINYRVYESGVNLVAELTNWLGYLIEPHWEVTIRIKTSSV